MAAKVELVGGQFQDLQGNQLALGYIKMKLSSDEEVNDSLICSGIEITINLDSTGNCVVGQSVWGNDVMSPVNSFYRVTVYSAQGQIVWGPNNQQVTGIGPFDVGTWIPNSVISWTPSVQPLALEVAGSALSSQILLDFVNSGNVVFTDLGNGQISATAPVTPATASLPRPDSAHFSMWTPTAQTGGYSYATPVNYWNILNDTVAGNIAGGNPFTPANGTSGGYFTSTNSGGFQQQAGASFFTTLRPITIRGAIRYSASSTSAGCNHYIGLSDYFDNPIAFNNLIAIGVQKISGSANPNFVLWIQFRSAPPQAGTQILVDSGVPVVNGQRYTFEITVASGLVTLFINGVSVATSNTTITTSPLALTWGMESSVANSTCALDFVYGEQ
jgi:hypothetical protein